MNSVWILIDLELISQVMHISPTTLQHEKLKQSALNLRRLMCNEIVFCFLDISLGLANARKLFWKSNQL